MGSLATSERCRDVQFRAVASRRTQRQRELAHHARADVATWACIEVLQQSSAICSLEFEVFVRVALMIYQHPFHFR
jgi:hypothetical protein